MRENHCLVGDCRDSLRQLAAEGVKAQTCVTSPPYWGLRDYGVDGQLGLEATPEAFVATMVEVFRLVRDVLADDGCLWLNLGDSYAAGCMTGTQGKTSTTGRNTGQGSGTKLPPRKGIYTVSVTYECGCSASGNNVSNSCPIHKRHVLENSENYSFLGPKQLVGIPWRVALALQADGWYLRQDIIWAKPNPMPESVTDRCTKSHEYLFLLTKQARYYFDAEAIREPSERPDLLGKKRLSGVEGLVGQRNDVGRQHDYCNPAGRNRRSVWTIATQPFSEAHFAVFPEALVKPCILAGSRPGDPVLDPFMGSGTVAKVAQDLGRRWVGCELNPEYAKLIEERTRQGGLTLG